MFFFGEWNKTRLPQKQAEPGILQIVLFQSFQTVSDLDSEGLQPFRNLRYYQEESSSRSSSSSSSRSRRSGSGGSGSSASAQKLLAAAVAAVVVVLVCLAPYAIHDSETPP